MPVRWIVAGVVALLAVGAGLAVVVLARSDDGAGRSAAVVTTTGPGVTAPTTLAPAVTEPRPVTPETTEPEPTTSRLPVRVPPAGQCGVEQGAILASVDAGVDGARERADLVECRLAPADPTWALVRLAPRPGTSFDVSAVLLHGGGGSWSIADAGTENVGCGQAPQQVIVDLGLFCAGASLPGR